jgi:small subunit ribosomal protein S6
MTDRQYELVYILPPDFTEQQATELHQQLEAVVTRMNGQIEKTENWGRRKLAYEVKKQLKGIYLFWKYLGDPGLVEEVERNLRLSDQVIRYYSVKVGENVDVATSTTDVTDETFASASVPGPDEEAIATGQAGARPFGDDDEEAGFDFEEAVFGSSDTPQRRSE